MERREVGGPLREIGDVAVLVLAARQRVLQPLDEAPAFHVLRFELVEQRAGRRIALAQLAKQVRVLLGMVEALGERIDIVKHRAEQLEIGRHPPHVDLADEIEEAVQHGGERAMLVLDDLDGTHDGRDGAGTRRSKNACLRRGKA